MNPKNNELKSINSIQFFTELRNRFLRASFLLLILFSILLLFANDLYSVLTWPLIRFLPSGHLVAIQIVSPFYVPFKLAFTLAVFLSVPYFLYQVWAFMAPALYRNEKRLLWYFLILSTTLFYLGVCFAYFVIFPLLFQFLAQIAPSNVVLSPDINEYFNFATKLLLIFGLLFEIPLVMVLLVTASWTTVTHLSRLRSYTIVAAFILGMLLAPPDIFSQTVLAVPIWLLYELGLLLSRLVKPRTSHERI